MNKTTKIFFPVHLNGGNRGCEGIAKGTSLILDMGKDNLIGLCTDVGLDSELGVDKHVTLLPSRAMSLLDRLKFRICSRIWNKERFRRYYQEYQYDWFLDTISQNDIMFSTGGDMLCYENNFINYTNNRMNERGVKTVLWGCSMGPENLTPEKEETLRKFSLIYARESLTKQFFMGLGFQHVCCYPDPAFVLKPEMTDMPVVFQKGDVVGVNISNFVLGGFTLDTSFGKQVKKLLDHILKETELYVLLIPHVTWAGQDDRIVANIIKNEYSSSERISILDISKKNYCHIRYIISQCKYFIGARTHAVISAYATCVPTLALGYSIKSRGIAKDIGLSECLVVDSKKTKSQSELLDSFKFLCESEEDVRKHLVSVMPEYSQKPYEVRKVLSELF